MCQLKLRKEFPLNLLFFIIRDGLLRKMLLKFVMFAKIHIKRERQMAKITNLALPKS